MYPQRKFGVLGLVGGQPPKELQQQWQNPQRRSWRRPANGWVGGLMNFN